jgi:hypothetical protein
MPIKSFIKSSTITAKLLNWENHAHCVHGCKSCKYNTATAPQLFLRILRWLLHVWPWLSCCLLLLSVLTSSFPNIINPHVFHHHLLHLISITPNLPTPLNITNSHVSHRHRVFLIFIILNCLLLNFILLYFLLILFYLISPTLNLSNLYISYYLYFF